MESRGRSSSTTPASMGAQLEERRVTRIRDVLDFPEELESRENCRESAGDLSRPASCLGRWHQGQGSCRGRQEGKV